MLTKEKMSNLILEKDKAKSDAAVDAMSEADAKRMLKKMLFAVRQLSKEGHNLFSTK